MNIRIPIGRPNVLRLLLSCVYALIHGKAVLEFEFDEENVRMDGEAPVLLTRKEANNIEMHHAKARAEAALLQEAIDEAVTELGRSTDPVAAVVAQELNDAKESTCTSQRVLH